jgi:hypothetical protein
MSTSLAGHRLRPAEPASADGLTPLAAGCFALVAGPYCHVLSPLLALASFASDVPGTRS